METVIPNDQMSYVHVYILYAVLLTTSSIGEVNQLWNMYQLWNKECK